MLFYSLPGKLTAQFSPSAASGDPQTWDTAVFQAYYDSDVDMFTWGTLITAIALFTLLLHLGIETKTWVRVADMVTSQRGLHVSDLTLPESSMRSSFIKQTGDCKTGLTVMKGNYTT